MLLALSATAIVVVALLWEVAMPRLVEAVGRHRAGRARVPDPIRGYDPGRERRAEQRARALLRSCVNEEEWAMYRDLGFIRVWGAQADGPGRGTNGAPYAYLVYPPKPDRPLPAADRPADQRVLRRVPRRDAALRLGAPARLRRRAGQVDGPHRRRAAADRHREHAPARPPDRPQDRPPRPVAPAAVGAPPRGPRAARRGRPRAVTAAGDGSFDLKHRSRALTEGLERAPARTYLKGIGLTDEDLAKPIIGVASTWIETMPCNFHLRALAAKVKEGIPPAGGTPMEFNTIAISDAIPMGTSGMKTSLVSREVVADSIELVARGHMFDAVVALSGCDKTIPGTVMALARLDVPSVMLYGGSVAPGRFQ